MQMGIFITNCRHLLRRRAVKKVCQEPKRRRKKYYGKCVVRNVAPPLGKMTGNDLKIKLHYECIRLFACAHCAFCVCILPELLYGRRDRDYTRAGDMLLDYPIP